MSAQKDHSPGRIPAGAWSQAVWVQQKTNPKKTRLRKRNLTGQRQEGRYRDRKPYKDNLQGKAREVLIPRKWIEEARRRFE